VNVAPIRPPFGVKSKVADAIKSSGVQSVESMRGMNDRVAFQVKLD